MFFLKRMYTRCGRCRCEYPVDEIGPLGMCKSCMELELVSLYREKRSMEKKEESKEVSGPTPETQTFKIKGYTIQITPDRDNVCPHCCGNKTEDKKIGF